MNGKKRFCVTSFLIIIIALVSFWGCHKTAINMRSMTPEEQFEYAKFFFDKKDFLKAKSQMMMVVMNNPGHLITEKAQFYLSESYFNLKEYLLAVGEYEKLIKSMPRSDFVDDARYKIGLCYFKLSPMYGLDQEYTRKAIYQFQVFLEEHPDSEWKPDAESKLSECRRKLARKSYKEGDQYRKMGIHPAAVIAYDWVLQNFYDTEFADDAQYWKGFCQYKLKEWEEAEKSFQDVLNKYPDSRWTGKAGQMLRKVQDEINRVRPERD